MLVVSFQYKRYINSNYLGNNYTKPILSAEHIYILDNPVKRDNTY